MNIHIKLLVEKLFDDNDDLLHNDELTLDELNIADKLGPPTTGIDGITYDVVDLGLPSGNLWCTLNIGAEKPEDPGCYFEPWAGVGFYKGKKTLSDDCIYKKHFYDFLHKDKATSYIGDNWYQPSEDDFIELIRNTTLSLTRIGRRNGIRIFNKQDSSKNIFIPCAGYLSSSSSRPQELNKNIALWTTDFVSDPPFLDLYYNFELNGTGKAYFSKRSSWNLMPIRGIYKK